MRRGLGSHLTHAKRCMRIKKRPAVVLAMATAGALAVAGIALAAASSTVSFTFTCVGRTTPNRCPQTTYTNGRLFVHTHTDYTGNAFSSATKRAQLFYDNDFQFHPSVTPKCDPPSSGTMKEAMAACGSSLVGTGRAQATGTGTSTLNGCVLAFNGTAVSAPTGVGSNTTLHPVVWLFLRVQAANPSSIDCSSPATNENGNLTIRLKGIIHRKTEASGAHPQFPTGTGTEMDFNNIPTGGPVTDVKVTFAKNTSTGGYVKGRCSHSNHVWRLITKFTYNDSTTQTVNSPRTCTVG
jgi:hypothetical protein